MYNLKRGLAVSAAVVAELVAIKEGVPELALRKKLGGGVTGALAKRHLNSHREDNVKLSHLWQ